MLPYSIVIHNRIFKQTLFESESCYVAQFRFKPVMPPSQPHSNNRSASFQDTIPRNLHHFDKKGALFISLTSMYKLRRTRRRGSWKTGEMR